MKAFLQVVMVASWVASFILWLMALIQSIARKDLKNSKVLYILLLIFISPIGMLAYFFVENRKKLGIATIVVFVLMILVPILFYLPNLSAAQ